MNHSLQQTMKRINPFIFLNRLRAVYARSSSTTYSPLLESKVFSDFGLLKSPFSLFGPKFPKVSSAGNSLIGPKPPKVSSPVADFVSVGSLFSSAGSSLIGPKHPKYDFMRAIAEKVRFVCGNGGGWKGFSKQAGALPDLMQVYQVLPLEDVVSEATGNKSEYNEVSHILVVKTAHGTIIICVFVPDTSIRIVASDGLTYIGNELESTTDPKIYVIGKNNLLMIRGSEVIPFYILEAMKYKSKEQEYISKDECLEIAREVTNQMRECVLNDETLLEDPIVEEKFNFYCYFGCASPEGVEMVEFDGLPGMSGKSKLISKNIFKGSGGRFAANAFKRSIAMHDKNNLTVEHYVQAVKEALVAASKDSKCPVGGTLVVKRIDSDGISDLWKGDLDDLKKELNNKSE